MNEKTFAFCMAFSVFLVIPQGLLIAGGDVDVNLRCHSPSNMIRLTIGNSAYNGSPNRYTWSWPFGGMDEGYVDVLYRNVQPYVLREDVFKSNPNYFRPGMSGSGSEGWWVFEDSDSASFPPRHYHQFATLTSSKDSGIVNTYYGQIKITFKRFDGSTGEKIINVQIQKRECEAYHNDKWIEVSPGRWEQQ